MMKFLGCLTAIAMTAASAPAVAQSRAPAAVHDLATVEMTGWTVGALAFGNVEPIVAGPTTMHDKLRAGPGLALSSLGEGVTLRPWTAAADVAGGGAGGLLLDVPIGGFTFTPSFGAARGEAATLGGASAVMLRSQLEVGYRFDNASRLSLGYSRITAYGGERSGGDVLSLSYRLPFGALLD